MKKLLSLFIVSMMILAVLAGCAAKKPAETPAPEQEPAATAAPTAFPAPTEAPIVPYEHKVSVPGADTPGIEELAKAIESQSDGNPGERSGAISNPAANAIGNE